MPIELTVLALSALLAVAQLIGFAIPANLQIGSKYLAGPRDDGLSLSGRTARLERAYKNHLEGLAIYTAAAVTVVLGNGSTGLTGNCALAYLGARLVYVPAYYFGWAPWRSLIWSVGFVATIVMLLAALLP